MWRRILCPSKNPSNHQPLLDRQFDSEAGSDVTFLVGQGTDTWRFPGHRSVLAESNPVFKAMLFYLDKSPDEVVPIVDVDGKAFDLLLRYLYKKDVIIQSVPTALMTLYAAQKYLCPGLMRHCICYLDQSLDINNALQIYEYISFYSGQCRTASAPPIEHLDALDNCEDLTVLCQSLLHNCLLFIDDNGSKILSLESFEDLKKESLCEILDRDTLNASEYVIYTAIERWSSLECKRCKLELSAENVRNVIGDDILFSVRYLLMSDKEFYEGPMQGNLLTKHEINTLYGYLYEMPVTNTTSTITKERLVKMKQKRVQPFSSKTSLGDRPSYEDKKKMKENKKKKNKEKDEPKKCTKDCFLDCLFTGLAFIFE